MLLEKIRKLNLRSYLRKCISNGVFHSKMATRTTLNISSSVPRFSILKAVLETSLGLLNEGIVILLDFLLLLFYLIDCHIIQLYIIVCSGFHTCVLILNLNLNVNVHEF